MGDTGPESTVSRTASGTGEAGLRPAGAGAGQRRVGSPSTRWAATELPTRSSRVPPLRLRPRSSPCSTGLRASTRCGLPLVETAHVIEMDDHPVESVRAKPDSSLVAAVRAVADGRGGRSRVGRLDTGRCSRRRLLHIRRLPGVRRPAIAVVIPARARPDACSSTPERMLTRDPRTSSSSRIWARCSRRRFSASCDPEVRLLSIGEEDEKGNQLTLDAHALLRASSLRFGGNTESRTTSRRRLGCRRDRRLHRQRRPEGARRDDHEACSTSLRDELDSSAAGRLGGLLIRPAARRVREPARSRDLRRRLSARPARPRRDRARLELARCHRERDPARGARRRPRRRRARGGAPCAC